MIGPRFGVFLALLITGVGGMAPWLTILGGYEINKVADLPLLVLWYVFAPILAPLVAGFCLRHWMRYRISADQLLRVMYTSWLAQPPDASTQTKLMSCVVMVRKLYEDAT